MAEVHPTALVHPEARIGEGTRIGAFAIVEAKVAIGKKCWIQDHAIIRDYSTLGDEVDVHPFAVVGGTPQHLRYKGEPTTVVVGNRVVLRECVTVHRGTAFGNQTTVVKDGVLIMAYSHVAHDCVVGENVILANGVQLAGHVRLGKGVVVGGMTGITQFCAVGDYAFIGAASILRKDLPPFLSGKGADFHVQGINIPGLKRQGFTRESILRLCRLFKIVYLQNLTVSQALEKATLELECAADVKQFLDFLKQSKQGIVR